jgi:hypothetical protein
MRTLPKLDMSKATWNLAVRWQKSAAYHSALALDAAGDELEAVVEHQKQSAFAASIARKHLFILLGVQPEGEQDG